MAEIKSKAGIVYDFAKEEILWEKAAEEQLPVADLVKLMTGFLAIEKCQDAAKRFAVSDKEGCARYQSLVNPSCLKPREEVSITDCVKYLLLTSANEAADALAVETAGSISEFCHQMNVKAAELGMENTVFADPSGLSIIPHHSSAKDLAVLCKAALSNPLLKEMLFAEEGVLPASNLRSEEFKYENRNVLPGMEDDHDNAEGDADSSASDDASDDANDCAGNFRVMKTGQSADAGICLAAHFEKAGAEYAIVVLGADSEETAAEDAKALIEECETAAEDAKALAEECEEAADDVEPEVADEQPEQEETAADPSGLKLTLEDILGVAVSKEERKKKKEELRKQFLDAGELSSLNN